MKKKFTWGNEISELFDIPVLFRDLPIGTHFVVANGCKCAFYSIERIGKDCEVLPYK